MADMLTREVPIIEGSSYHEAPVARIDVNVNPASMSEHKRFITGRKVLAAAAVGFVVFAYFKVEDFIHAIEPQVSVNIDQIDTNTLESFQDTQDSRIMQAKAIGGLSVKADGSLSWLFIHNFDYWGLLKENAGVNYKTGLNFMSLAGAVEYKPFSTSKAGQIGVEEIVNLDQLQVEATNPVPKPTGTDGLIIQVLDATEFKNDRNERVATVEQLEQNTVITSCSNLITEGQTGAILLANAEVANSKHEFAEAEAAAPDQQTKASLARLIDAPEMVIFVDNNGKVIDPSQVQIPNLPEQTQPGTFNADGFTVTIATSGSCQPSPTVEKTIDEAVKNSDVTISGLVTAPQMTQK
jgi:hypothetical protein